MDWSIGHNTSYCCGTCTPCCGRAMLPLFPASLPRAEHASVKGRESTNLGGGCINGRMNRGCIRIQPFSPLRLRSVPSPKHTVHTDLPLLGSVAVRRRYRRLNFFRRRSRQCRPALLSCGGCGCWRIWGAPMQPTACPTFPYPSAKWTIKSMRLRQKLQPRR